MQLQDSNLRLVHFSGQIMIPLSFISTLVLLVKQQEEHRPAETSPKYK